MSVASDASRRGRELWVGVIGVLATVIFGIVAVAAIKEARDWVRDTVLAYWLRGVLATLIVLFACGIVLAIWRTLDLKSTKTKLQALKSESEKLITRNSRLEADFRVAMKTRDEAITESSLLKQRLSYCIPYQKEDRKRWESMTQSPIRFGHLAYKPFLKYDDKDDPCGLGVDWLKQLLEFSLRGKSVRIKRFDDRGDWSNILDGLIKKDYDVVATPLFATFDRSKRVAFTAPLFFSNVGLYVSRETSSHNAWNDMTVDNMTVDKMKSIIERAGKLRFLSVEGEISEKLAAKYSDKASISSFGSSKTLSSLFETIADSNDPYCALFCESFYAEIQPLVESKKVVNVLPWHQILYPVCFAVRLGDYQLLNLLNIRLIQFTQNGDALRLLEEVAKADYGLNAEDVKKHFVAEWPINTDEIDTEVQRRA